MPTSLLDTVFLLSLLVAALPVVTLAWTIDDLFISRRRPRIQVFETSNNSATSQGCRHVVTQAHKSSLRSVLEEAENDEDDDVLQQPTPVPSKVGIRVFNDQGEEHVLEMDSPDDEETDGESAHKGGDDKLEDRGEEPMQEGCSERGRSRIRRPVDSGRFDSVSSIGSLRGNLATLSSSLPSSPMGTLPSEFRHGPQVPTLRDLWETFGDQGLKPDDPDEARRVDPRVDRWAATGGQDAGLATREMDEPLLAPSSNFDVLAARPKASSTSGSSSYSTARSLLGGALYPSLFPEFRSATPPADERLAPFRSLSAHLCLPRPHLLDPTMTTTLGLTPSTAPPPTSRPSEDEIDLTDEESVLQSSFARLRADNFPPPHPTMFSQNNFSLSTLSLASVSSHATEGAETAVSVLDVDQRPTTPAPSSDDDASVESERQGLIKPHTSPETSMAPTLEGPSASNKPIVESITPRKPSVRREVEFSPFLPSPPLSEGLSPSIPTSSTSAASKSGSYNDLCMGDCKSNPSGRGLGLTKVARRRPKKKNKAGASTTPLSSSPTSSTGAILLANASPIYPRVSTNLKNDARCTNSTTTTLKPVFPYFLPSSHGSSTNIPYSASDPRPFVLGRTTGTSTTNDGPPAANVASPFAALAPAAAPFECARTLAEQVMRGAPENPFVINEGVDENAAPEWGGGGGGKEKADAGRVPSTTDGGAAAEKNNKKKRKAAGRK